MAQAQYAAETQVSGHSAWYVASLEHLVTVVQQLSHARDIMSIAAIVRKAARELTGADGATFVLKDGDTCYYVDEDAIEQLWKGQRFPLKSCVSGWVMEHATPAIIPDIYADERVPAEAYRPTFVKSMAMVPIRRNSPIGAIGNYWAQNYQPTNEQIAILQALADTASVALENAQLYEQLHMQLKHLNESNLELSRFAWVASHDLQEPLRTIVTQVELLERRYSEQLDSRAAGYIQRAVQGASRLQHLIDDLLVHARAEKIEDFRPLALGAVLAEVQQDLHAAIASSKTIIEASELPWVWGEPAMLARLWQNLISNAVKFARADTPPRITITAEQHGAHWLFTVEDNGIGIEDEFHQRVFGLFQRLHTQERYPGSGVGLATCKKIVELHGGRIWLESKPGEGSRFFFTLPVPDSMGTTLSTQQASRINPAKH